MGAIVWQALALSRAPWGGEVDPAHRAELTADRDPETWWAARPAGLLELWFPRIEAARAVRLRILSADAGTVTVSALLGSKGVGEVRASLDGGGWQLVEVPLRGSGVERLFVKLDQATTAARVMEVEVEVDTDQRIDPRQVESARAELAGSVTGRLASVDGFDTPFAAASYACTPWEEADRAVVDDRFERSRAVRAAGRLASSDSGAWRFAPTEPYPLPPGADPWVPLRSLLRADLFSLAPDPDARFAEPTRRPDPSPPVRVLGRPEAPRAVWTHVLELSSERTVTLGDDTRWTATWSDGRLDQLFVQRASWASEDPVPDPAAKAATPEAELLISPTWDDRRITGWEGWFRSASCDADECLAARWACRGT